jgi:hypothetical protein
MIRHPIITVVLVSILVRLALIILVSSGVLGGFALDDATYLRIADIFAAGQYSLLNEYDFQLWNQTWTFLWPLKTLFEVTGPDRIVGQLYVASWGTAAAAFTTAIALRRFPVLVSIFAGGVVALLPSQVLWSSLTLKDPAVWAVLTALGLLVALANRSEPRSLPFFIVGIVILLLAMAHLRDHTLVIAAWSVPVAFYFGRSDTRLWRIAAGVVLVVAIPMTVGLGPGGIRLLIDSNLAEQRLLNAQGARSAYVEQQAEDVFEAMDTDAESAQDLRATRAAIAALSAQIEEINTRAEGESDGGPGEQGEPVVDHELEELQERVEELQEQEATLAEAAPEEPETAGGTLDVEDTVGANISHLPRGLSVMLFEPVPWRDPTSSNMNLARWEMVLWYPLLALAAIGLFNSRKYLDALAFPILAGGGMLFVYSLAEGNIGTAFRHRGEFVWTIALLAACGGWHLYEQRRIRSTPGVRAEREKLSTVRAG